MALSALQIQQEDQRLLALDPYQSVWVSASAGSGKTTLLTQRVLRLLLQNRLDNATRLPNILCLTYTNAAAAEMQNRVHKQLAGWATLSEAELQNDLEKTFEIKTDAKILKKARRLFAEILDKPDAMRIMTMHAFCQMILNRFPHEAGLAPHFTLLEGENEKRFQDGVLANFYAQVSKNPELSQALDVLGRSQATSQTRDMLKYVFHNAGKWARHFTQFANETAFQKDMQQKLALDYSGSEVEYLGIYSSSPHVPEAALREAVQFLNQGGVRDKATAEKISNWLSSPDKRIQLFQDYHAAFITKDGEVKKTLTQTVIKKSESAAETLLHEAQRVMLVQETAIALRYYHHQCAFYRLSRHLWDMYVQAKRKQAQLTYDDLILKTRDVLHAPDIAPWMLYKLDGGIDHILIDEAQDTSPEQWEIIHKLLDDMLSGEGARAEVVRTLFVVGDEKQSIYSFQGADHRNYLHVKNQLFKRFAEANKPLVDLERIQSFRSTSAVLEFVDNVFDAENISKGVSLSPIRHYAHRKIRGCVEMWPTIIADSKKPTQAWHPPLEREDTKHAYVQLATQIADTIHMWLLQGWQIKSERAQGGARAVRPDDIIILLQRRSDLLSPIIRALKEKNIPVAGIDRMVLHEQAAVQDILSLCRFLLLPRDDLTLAEVLRGPLIRISDAQLFEIAHGRKSTLWEALQAHPQHNAICDYLKIFLNKVDRISAFDFLTLIFFTPCPGNVLSGKAALLHRMGVDAIDPLEQLLSAARNFDANNPLSLQLFVRAVAQDDSELKREQSSASGEVRIMTTHSAKGLEAKIIFMPDLMRDPHKSGRQPTLIWGEGGVPVILPTGAGKVAYVEQSKTYVKETQSEENRRLLYVALTRAADMLILCSALKNKETDKTPWLNHCRDAMVKLAGHSDAQVVDTSLRFGDVQTLCQPDVVNPVAAKSERIAPTWLTQAISSTDDTPRVYNPSLLVAKAEKQLSPVSMGATSSFQRGRLLHRLLQLLPEIPVETQEASALRFLTRNTGLSEKQCANDVREVLAVLHHPVFANVFSKDAKAELPIIGSVLGKYFSGQLDRVWITEKEVLVIDFKTNRPPPNNLNDVDDGYLAQMACYALLLQQIYPGKAVRAGLLWTHTLTLMELDDAAHARGVKILATLGGHPTLDPAKTNTI